MKKKPSPMVYEETLAKLGLASNQCIAFEDSQSGFEAATTAGLNIVVVPTPISQSSFGHIDYNAFNPEGVCKLKSLSEFLPVLDMLKNL
jgi:beta-phosphoglucomutase-like phosphatase (HAD superfamily)